jgi:hypothetical protein
VRGGVGGWKSLGKERQESDRNPVLCLIKLDRTLLFVSSSPHVAPFPTPAASARKLLLLRVLKP